MFRVLVLGFRVWGYTGNAPTSWKSYTGFCKVIKGTAKNKHSDGKEHGEPKLQIRGIEGFIIGNKLIFHLIHCQQDKPSI